MWRYYYIQSLWDGYVHHPIHHIITNHASQSHTLTEGIDVEIGDDIKHKSGQVRIRRNAFTLTKRERGREGELRRQYVSTAMVGYKLKSTYIVHVYRESK